MKKKIFAMGFGAALSLMATGAMADGLSLQSIGLDAPVKVLCNGTALPYELKPDAPVNNIPWWMVSAAFGSQSVLNCQFMLDNKSNDSVGSATLTLSVLAGTGEASNVQHSPSYSVTIVPGEKVAAQSMTVRIQKNP
ncbi:MAG: hypothetical protein Q8L78_01625 [Coxiellaceae bacterium]|nr:hypothetical protein [Coxiellaceae bacterium]